MAPIPNSDTAIRQAWALTFTMELKPQSARVLAVSGLLLQLGIPGGWTGLTIGMLQTFENMSGDITAAASQITGGVVLALKSMIIGQSAALVGLGLLLAALFSGRIREPWVLKWGRIAMLPWLVIFPLGTVIGALMLVYFSRHRGEFAGVSDGNNAGGTTDPPSAAPPQPK
jgi:hypothetical protein